MSKHVWFIALAASLHAQTYTERIRGRVSDPAGRPAAGAVVTVTGTAAHAIRKAATNEVGDYIISFLMPGDYRRTVIAPGFKEGVRESLRLQLNQPMTVDLRLELGQVTESVQVSATATQLNSVSPEIGHVLESESLINVPLAAANSRGLSPVLLAKLRDFRVYERLRMQFRSEAYGATKHPQWGNPGTSRTIGIHSASLRRYDDRSMKT